MISTSKLKGLINVYAKQIAFYCGYTKIANLFKISLVTLLVNFLIENKATAQFADITISGSVTSAGTWSGGTAGPYVFTPNTAGSAANIITTDILNRLGGLSGFTASNVTISTTALSGSGGTGSITINSSLVANNTTATARNLTFTANNNITISVSSAIDVSGTTPGSSGNGNVGHNVALTATNGTVTIASAITTSGGNGNTSGTGGASGTISITAAGLLSTSANLIANGGNGAGVGKAATAGGNITISSTYNGGTAVNITGYLSSLGGNGGTNTTGVNSSAGAGGNGGTISVTGTNNVIVGASSIIDSVITRGGNGGDNPSATGGGGGAGGKGGAISLTSSQGTVTVSGNCGFNSSGGNGGIGQLASAGDAGNGNSIAINGKLGITIGASSADKDSLITRGGISGNNLTAGGSGGAAGLAGNGGNITLGSTNGTISINSSGGFNASGGNSGYTLANNGGKAGGTGGTILIGATTGTLAVSITPALISNGGLGSNTSGTGTPGIGGVGGPVSVLSSVAISLDSILNNGGNSGTIPATGNSNNNKGGTGGLVTITSGSAAVTIIGAINSSGGNGSAGYGSSAGAGGDANSTSPAITITAPGGITTNGALLAQGGIGGTASGAAGGAGGAGKGITLNSTTTVSINGMISTLGGNAGNGNTSTSGVGGTGGNISITGTTGITIGASSATNDSLITRGGNGGNNTTVGGGGGNGGLAGTIALSSNGPIAANSVGGFSASGGIGGKGFASTAGAGGAGNTITIGSASTGAITINGALNSGGGAGGTCTNSTGGSGGAAATITIVSGNAIITDSLIANGGNSGTASNSMSASGAAAAITVTSGSSSSITVNGAVSASGGFNTSTTTSSAGGGGTASTINIIGGSGGINITSTVSSNGGSGGSSSGGIGGGSANGSTITIAAPGSISVTGTISATGGNAGTLSSTTRAGGTGGNISIGTASTTTISTSTITSGGGNGSGHATANPGSGGGSGTVTLLATGNISTGDIIANGANAGNTTGASSQAASGGAGGAISITSSTTGNVTVTGAISSIGGTGTTASSTSSATNTGGTGGSAGNNGSSIAIKISAITGISVTSNLTAEGGAGGTNFSSTNGGHGGAGGTGMGISLLSPGPISVGGSISSKGGASGLAKTIGTGGRGGDGGAINIGTAGATTTIATGTIASTGANGGDGIGQPGQGGNGAIVTVLATGTIATSAITSDGGNSGNTVSGSQNNSGGNGAAVNVTTTGAAATITVTGAVSSSGGTGSSTSNAAATTNTTGGGGTAGNASSVAINIVGPGGVSISSSVTAKGGNGGSNASTTSGNGHGGSGNTGFNIVITSVNGSAIIGGAINASGGTGGNATSGKTNGSGAAAGTITITGGTGVTVPQSISAIGGLAGTGGTGGSSSANNNITISDKGSAVTTGNTSNNAGVSGVITGLNFTSSGTGILKLSAANQYTGTTTITDTLQIGIAGALPVAASNNVTLNGGSISTAGGAGGAGISNGPLLGTLTVTGSGAAITLGTGSHILKFGNATTGTYGTASLIINNWLNVPGSSGTAGQVFIGPLNQLSSTQLGTITFKGYCGTAKYVPSGGGELTPTASAALNLISISQTPIPACLNATVSISIGGVAAGSTTVNYKIGSNYYSSAITSIIGGVATFTTPALTQAIGTALVIDSVNNGNCWLTVSGSTTLSISVASTAITSVTQSPATACPNTSTAITIAGLTPGTTYTATYSIGGGTIQTSPAIIADGLGNASYSIVLTPIMTGKALQILTLTDGGCTKNVTGSTSGTLSVFQPVALNSVIQTPAPACINSAATITLGGLRNGTAYTVVYKIAGGSNQTTTTTAANISGNASFTSIPLSAVMNNTKLQIVSLDSLPATCAATTYIDNTVNTYCTLSVYQTVTWLGIDTDWGNANNWCGGVPDSTTDVVIPTVASSKYPVLDATLASGLSKGAVKNINISSSSASVTLAATGILSIAGSITNSGNFNASAGTIRMCGTANQTLDGSIFVQRTINNLIICNNTTTPSVNLANTAGDTLNITNIVSFGYLNNASFKTNNNLTLKSTLTNTASIGDISNGGGSTGNNIIDSVIIERYFPAHRAWRLVTAPVKAAGAPTISKSWQEGLHNTDRTNPIFNSPYGTIITRNTGSADGYDQGSTNLPSIYRYTGGLWKAPTNTDTDPITTYPGYLLFVRGSRNYTVTNQYNPATTATLRVKGLVNQDSVTIAGTGTTIIGNPFASTINYTGIYSRASNLSATYYIWDPFTTGSNSVGSFITMHYDGGGSYSAVPDPTDPDPLNDAYRHPIDKNGNIQSGQAIVAYFTNGDPAAVPPTGSGLGSSKIKEIDKVSANNSYYFRPAAPLTGIIEKLRTNLYVINSDGSTSLQDGVLNLYNDNYTNDVNYLEDAPKVGNISETIGLFREKYNLAIDSRKIISNTDTVYYSLFGMQKKTYILHLETTSLDHPGLSGILIDSFTQARTPISLNGVTNYKFTVDATPTSSALHRFTVLFIPAENSIPLPVTFTSVKAVQQSDNNVAVQWTVANQINIKAYNVQKSTDGIHFITVSTIASNAGNAVSLKYNWIDNNAATGSNYYRIVSIGNDQLLGYSNIAVVNNTSETTIAVYPNPVKDNLIRLQFTNASTGVYNLRLIDNIGQVLFTKPASFSGGTGNVPVQIYNSITKGTYTLEITKPDNTKESILLVVE